MTQSRGEERDQHYQTDCLTPLKPKKRICSFFFLLGTAAGMYFKHRKAFCLEALPHLQVFWEHQVPPAGVPVRLRWALRVPYIPSAGLAVKTEAKTQPAISSVLFSHRLNHLQLVALWN